MKIFIISPNTGTQLSEYMNALSEVGDLVLIDKMQPWSEITELYEGDEPRIVAVDPDFSDWQFPNDVIDKIPNLKAICLQTTSFSWVDIEYCKELGVPVTNLIGFSAIAVAEWATLVTLSLARKLPIVIKDNWKLDFGNHRGHELRGKTAGVIGLGRIGSAFAENMSGLGMHVQYWSKNSRDDRFSAVALDTLMSSSDVIILSTANNAETKILLTDELLKTMKATAIFMTITDALYDQELVLDMVKTGKLYGYGFEDEKNAFGIYEGNVWNGPALGWCTDESMSKNAQLWVNSILSAAKSEYPTQVNS
ncbi:MAG: NAD(P)-dependent oxidoreductase [Patescibacteria group bacterium]|nr:NAD(P)-dependent oxidoreductase [Patescibacteria group bacterium]